MSRASLRNLILLLVVVGLGLLVYFGPGGEDTQPTVRLSELDPDTVTRIRIQRPEGPEILLVKEGEAWFLEEPIRIAANLFRVQSLLRLAGSVSHGQYPLQDGDLARFGLTTPRVILQLDELALAFGDTEPLAFRRYVGVGETLHLIDDVDYHHLTAKAAGFVSLKLLPEDAQITGLSLPGLRLVRSADGGWSAQPASPGASADALQALVDEWTQARALEINFHTDEAPGATVTLNLGGADQPLRFTILERAPQLVLARADLGLAYHFPQAAAERLLQLTRPPQAEPDFTPEDAETHGETE